MKVHTFLITDNMKVKFDTDRRHMNEKLMHGAGGWNGRPLDILWAMQSAKGAPDHAFVMPNRMYYNARSDEMSIIFDPNTDPSTMELLTLTSLRMTWMVTAQFQRQRSQGA